MWIPLITPEAFMTEQSVRRIGSKNTDNGLITHCTVPFIQLSFVSPSQSPSLAFLRTQGRWWDLEDFAADLRGDFLVKREVFRGDLELGAGNPADALHGISIAENDFFKKSMSRDLESEEFLLGLIFCFRQAQFVARSEATC